MQTYAIIVVLEHSVMICRYEVSVVKGLLVLALLTLEQICKMANGLCP